MHCRLGCWQGVCLCWLENQFCLLLWVHFRSGKWEEMGFLALWWVKKQFGNFWLRCSSIIFVPNKTVLLQGCSALGLGLSGTGFSRAAMPGTAPAPPFASPFTMYLMIPGKDLQILLQAPEELKYNSFKNWCLLFSICMFVCIQLALLWTTDSFHVPVLLVLPNDQRLKILSDVFKITCISFGNFSPP